jgi:hypothetical protein
MNGACSTCGREESFIQGYGGNYEAKRPLGRPRSRRRRGLYRVMVGIMKQRDHLEDLGIEGGKVYTGLWWKL